MDRRDNRFTSRAVWQMAFASVLLLLGAPMLIAQQKPTLSPQQVEAAEKYIKEAEAKQTPQQRKEAQEIANFRLSTDNLEKMSKAMEAFNALGDSNPELKDACESLNSEDRQKTMQETVSCIERHPSAVSALRSAGMTPKEFVLTTYAMMINSFGLAYKQMGVKTLFPGASEANMNFIETHQEAIKKLTPPDQQKSSPQPDDH
ncbi:MAG: hypothetical protein JOZ10_14505 [Acidobacteria bacterium]|nr:hypothetical protein [Acidobacteriota bacterium]